MTRSLAPHGILAPLFAESKVPARSIAPAYFFGTQNSRTIPGMEIRKLTRNMPE